MSSTDVAEEILTAKEAAVALRIPLRTMYDLIDRGEVPAIKLGRRRLVLRETVQGILDQGRRLPTVALEDDDEI
jgi:excisionase family DNA binding protein